jgi:REP element-mobilizing transposase RayT
MSERGYAMNDATLRRRHSIRLRNFDYSQAGAYFITICIQGRQCLLGEIVEGETRSNNAGRMVKTLWDELPGHYPGIEVDEFCVMPNHVHGIIIMNGTAGLSLPDAAHRFKTMTTTRYIKGVKQNGWQPFFGKLWQRNYWERIIRNEAELNGIREYIRNNPAQWAMDDLHIPAAVGAAPCGRPFEAPCGRPSDALP